MIFIYFSSLFLAIPRASKVSFSHILRFWPSACSLFFANSLKFVFPLNFDLALLFEIFVFFCSHRKSKLQSKGSVSMCFHGKSRFLLRRWVTARFYAKFLFHVKSIAVARISRRQSAVLHPVGEGVAVTGLCFPCGQKHREANFVVISKSVLFREFLSVATH